MADPAPTDSASAAPEASPVADVAPAPAAAPAAARPAPTRFVAQWRAAKGTVPHLYAMASRRHRWQPMDASEPTTLTEAEYDAAISGLAGLSLG